MRIKNFEEFVEDNAKVVNELSRATIDAAHVIRKDQLHAKVMKGDGSPLDFNKMSALYAHAKNLERYQTEKNISPLIRPCYEKAQEVALKLDSVVKNGDIYGTIVLGLKRKGHIQKKILSMFNGNGLVFGEINERNQADNETGHRWIIVRHDNSSKIFVPQKDLLVIRQIVQEFLNLEGWRLEVTAKLNKFAHTEGSHTITTAIQSELPDMAAYKSPVKVEDLVASINDWVS